MKREIIRLLLSTLVLLLVVGCGSRPGFEEDFTSESPPDAVDKTLTDEEIQEAQERERQERLGRIDELREEERRLYIESDGDVDFEAPVDEYRLAQGDRFRVRFMNQPEMDVVMTVRPDGMASFDLLGDLPVAGQTPGDLARTLEEMYSVYLQNPQINLVIEAFNSQRFFVMGEVNRPGEFQLTTPTSLVQAVAMAGSWTDDAKTEEVMVIRLREDRTPVAFKVNLKEIMKGSVYANLYLRNFDIVYIPMGRLAGTANFVDNFFDIVLPPIDAAWKTSVLLGYNNR